MSLQDITVVITSFKSGNKIFECINSISQEVKILVIENSNDSDLKTRLNKDYKNVECVLSKENLGYAKGNNLGLKNVSTKFALIINPDAKLEKNAISNFFISAKNKPNFSIISPMIQEGQNENDLIKSENNLIEVETVKGFAMFLNLEQFKEIGFFDDNFFIYFEEIDLCRRLRYKNKKIFLDSNIIVFHPKGGSHDDNINFEMEISRNWHWMWSTFYFHKKYDGYSLSLIKTLPKLFSAMLKFLLYLLMFKKEKRKIYFSRFSGLLNSMLLNKSWYRPNIDKS
jgi:N-acetylglucosaminyl-diphospho-decaprenol L-rhamnosyltransferase